MLDRLTREEQALGDLGVRQRFAEEGVLRSFMPSERGRDDYVLYAIVHTDRARLES